MDLSAIIDEFNRRKAQAGQGIADTLGLQKKPTNWFQQMQQGQNAVVTPEQRTNVNKELADMLERFMAGVVPEPIRARDRAMQTDPSAAAKPFTSEEVKGMTPFVTAAAPIAYHGTPHTFDKFDASKIGTGQGAQSYGHGLYFAENPEVAKSYSDYLGSWQTLQGLKQQDAGVPGQVAEWLWSAKTRGTPDLNILRDKLKTISPAAAPEQLDKWISEGQQIFNKLKGGNTYQVNIPDQHVAKMLDWDKPLSEQPEIVKALANSKILPHGVDANTGRMTGEQFHNWLEKFYNKPQGDLSKALNDAGIPGIKYLDQGSRDVKQVLDFSSLDKSALKSAQIKKGGLSINDAVKSAVWETGNVDKAIAKLHETADYEVAGPYREAANWLEANKSRLYLRPEKPMTSNFVVFDPAILEDVTKK